MAVNISLTNLVNLQNETTAVTAINANNITLTTAFQNVLALDGSSPNQMHAPIDMNSNQIINLPNPATTSSPLRLQDLNSFIGGGTINTIPAGGATGQALTKTSGVDYAVNWSNVDTNLTGPITSVGNATSIASQTGTGSTFAMNTSPVLITPTIGAATATSINKVIITPPATSSTITIVDGTTLTTAGNATVSGINTGDQTITPQGRLTLLSLNPVMLTTQAAKTTIFYTPYIGNYIPLYNGTTMVPTLFVEVGVATTDTTKNPAAIGASKVNDWFIWNDSGTIRISHGPDWTSDNLRSAGTALAMINGILTNNVSITNGPAANRGTYVGTTRSNASSQIDFIYGAAASGGTAAFFGVWNYYNRTLQGTAVTDSGTSYTYASATIRQARASAGNQITYVIGVQEDVVSASIYQRMDTPAVISSVQSFGLGSDSTTAYWPGAQLIQMNGSATSVATSTGLTVPILVGIGVHSITMLQSSDSSNTTTYNNTPAILSAMIRM